MRLKKINYFWVEFPQILHLMFSDGPQKTSCVCISGWNRALSSDHPSIFVCPLTRRLTQASQLIIRQTQKTVVNKCPSHQTNGHQREISSDSHSEEGGQLEGKRWTDSLFLFPPPDLVKATNPKDVHYTCVNGGWGVSTKYTTWTRIFRSGSTKIMNRMIHVSLSVWPIWRLR